MFGPRYANIFGILCHIWHTEYVTLSVLNMYPPVMIINAGWKMPEAGQLARWVEEDDNAGARCVHHWHCAGQGTIGYQFSRLPQFWHRYGGEYTIFGETGQILVSQIKCSLDQDTIPHHIQQICCVFHSINIKVEAAPSLYARAGNSAESVVTINNPRCLHSVFYLAPALPAPFCAARPGVIGGSKKTTNKNMNIFIFGGLWSKTRGVKSW